MTAFIRELQHAIRRLRASPTFTIAATITLGGAAALFMLVALGAAAVPAFRTTRVNPIVALGAT